MGVAEARGVRAYSSACAVLFLVLFVLIAPQASALENVSGTFTTRNVVDLADLADATFVHPSAMLAPDLSKGAAVHLSVASAYVCYTNETFAHAKGIGPIPDSSVAIPPKNHPCGVQSDFTLDATGSATGPMYIGWYVDTMSLTGNASGITVDTEHDTRFASTDAQTATPGDPDGNLFFAEDLNGSNVVFSGTGQFSGVFSGTLKIRGLVTTTTSSAGTEEHNTGEENPSGVAGEQTESWLSVRAENASFTFRSGAPVRIAASAVTGTVRGTISLSAEQGLLVASEARYLPSNSTFRDQITGTFDLRFSPSETTGPASHLTLQGPLTATSLQRVPVPPAPWRQTNLPLVVAGAVVTTGLAVGGGLLLYKRRKPTALPTQEQDAVDEYATSRDGVSVNLAPNTALEAKARMDLAVGFGEWPEALMWADAGLQFAPRDIDLCMSKARHLRRLGNLEAALDAFELADLAGAEMAKIELALTLVRVGDLERAVATLRKDLLGRPDHVCELNGEPEFESLRGRPDFDAIVRTARGALAKQG